MNSIVFNNDLTNRFFEFFENEKYKVLLENLVKQNNKKEERIAGQGMYLCIEKDQLCYCLLVNETTNSKDARYIAKHYILAIKSACTFRKKQEDISESIDKVILHNTKNINNSINLKLLSILKGDEFYKYDDKIGFIRSLIQTNYVDYAKELLNLYKFSNQIQFEYIVLTWLNPSVNKAYLNYASHNIYKVIELAKFVAEDSLAKRNIKVEIEKTKKEVICDFDILKSCFSQIFENCSKYCKENSTVEISFNFSSLSIIIDISMESLYHDDDDIVKIFLPGQRGKQATENGFKGSGLGLYIIQTLLSICNIGIKFVRMPNTKITIDKNLKYSSNIFVITIPNN